jgi:hypothetical protein
MLSNLDTAWRYPLALLLGLLTGLYIGGMLATIYEITAFRESLDTLSPMGPWFLRYAWADLAARPSVLQGALIITGAVTVALSRRSPRAFQLIAFWRDTRHQVVGEKGAVSKTPLPTPEHLRVSRPQFPFRQHLALTSFRFIATFGSANPLEDYDAAQRD